MKKEKQLDLFKFNKKRTHGGEEAKGKRKNQRPLSSKKWIHHVMKSNYAKGAKSFAKYRGKIENILKNAAKEFGLELAEVIVMSDHIHTKLRIHNRELYKSYSKSINSQIANLITGAKKGNKLKIKFWDSIPWTRVLNSAFEELQLAGYFQANRIEREQGYEAREDYRKDFNERIRKSPP